MTEESKTQPPKEFKNIEKQRGGLDRGIVDVIVDAAHVIGAIEIIVKAVQHIPSIFDILAASGIANFTSQLKAASFPADSLAVIESMHRTTMVIQGLADALSSLKPDTIKTLDDSPDTIVEVVVFGLHDHIEKMIRETEVKSAADVAETIRNYMAIIIMNHVVKMNLPDNLVIEDQAGGKLKV